MTEFIFSKNDLKLIFLCEEMTENTIPYAYMNLYTGLPEGTHIYYDGAGSSWYYNDQHSSERKSIGNLSSYLPPGKKFKVENSHLLAKSDILEFFASFCKIKVVDRYRIKIEMTYIPVRYPCILLIEQYNSSMCLNYEQSCIYNFIKEFYPVNMTIKNADDMEEYRVKLSDFIGKLYSYQKQTLSWLMNNEKDGAIFPYHLSKYVPVKYGNNYITHKSSGSGYSVLKGQEMKGYIDIISDNQIIYDEKYEDKVVNYRINGGIIADKIGTGKTVTMISLIQTNQSVELPKLRDGFEKSFYTPIKATLVIAPKNITKQWFKEFNKWLHNVNSGGMNIIVLNTIKELESAVDNGLEQYDVVICSYSVITDNYKIFDNKKDKIFKKEEDPKKYLFLYKWHRVVYDEFHEKFNSTRTNFIKIIRDYIRARYTWGISGTPNLENKVILQNLMHLLQIRDELDNPIPYNNLKCCELIPSCIRRNEKLELPPLKNLAKVITLSSEEKKFYEAVSPSEPEYGMSLCCSNSCTNKGGSSVIKDTIESDIHRFSCRIKKLETEIDSYVLANNSMSDTVTNMFPNETIEDFYYVSVKDHEKNTKESRKKLMTDPAFKTASDIATKHLLNSEKIKSMKPMLQSLKQTVDSLNELLLDDGKQTCSMCLNDTENSKILTARCCPVFKTCQKCMSELSVSGKISCMNCNNEISTDINMFKVVEKNKLNIDRETGLSREKYSTKIIEIIKFIKNLDQCDKVILFAKWTTFLSAIVDAMDKCKIDYADISGSTRMREESIERFKTQNACRVIILSSENQASGLQLTEANHVIIAHPFFGEKGAFYEKQAIGRAYRLGQKREVQVTYFIANNTVEEYFFKKHVTEQDIAVTYLKTDEVDVDTNTTSEISSDKSVEDKATKSQSSTAPRKKKILKKPKKLVLPKFSSQNCNE